MDHTDEFPAAVYQKIQQLNGNANGRVGISKSLEVSPGDQVSISAYVKYLSPSTDPNPNAFITALASAFGVSSGSTGEAGKIFSGLNSFATLVPNGDHPNDDETPPKAFVTILLFDRNYVLQDATWDQVSTTGASTHDLLTASYTVKQPGYAYFFVSNEHPIYVDIYFDDVTVSHTQSPIVSGSDYYPFGLVMDGMEITDEAYRYGYQGQFSEKDLTTGWNEFELRMYDARFGRWLSPDSYGQYASPYIGMGNAPQLKCDFNGGMSFNFQVAFVRAALGAGLGTLTEWAAGGSKDQIGRAAIIGAAIGFFSEFIHFEKGVKPRNLDRVIDLEPVLVQAKKVVIPVLRATLMPKATVDVELPEKMGPLNISVDQPLRRMIVPDPQYGFGNSFETNRRTDIGETYDRFHTGSQEDRLISFLRSNHHKVRLIEVTIDTGNTASSDAQLERVKSNLQSTLIRWRIPRTKIKFDIKKSYRPGPRNQGSSIKIFPYE